MDPDTNPGADSAPEPTSIVSVPGTDTFHSPSSAARALANHRYSQREASPDEPDESAVEATPDESAQADAAPPEEAPGETESQPESEAELPPIEPPRSWTKDEKDRFQSLPRETQEYIASREQEREREVRRSQNEAAEKLKGLTAKEQAVDQARQQYESALPILMQNLQSAMAGEFSDIATMADVQRMANDDFPRYVRWDAQQKQLAAVQQEISSAQQRQTVEKQQSRNDFMRREAELFADKVPEIADEAQRSKLQTAAVSVLKDLGFKDEELAQYWNGEKDISIHDHRLHLLLRESVQFRDARKAAATKLAVPKPSVQRPGVAKPKGADVDARLQALTQKIDSTSGMNQLRAAAQLVATRRQAAR